MSLIVIDISTGEILEEEKNSEEETHEEEDNFMGYDTHLGLIDINSINGESNS